MDKQIAITCIVCPQGCKLTVRYCEETKAIEVFNHKCNRGQKYALNELTNPTRALTATVTIKNGFHNRLPVKSSTEIPKHLNFEMMKLIHRIKVEAPVILGQVIISDILGTGIDIIATRDMGKKVE